MIEELEKTESTWSRLPIAGRNKAMLQKWKKELKVSSSCLLFILILIQDARIQYWLKFGKT